MGRDITLAMLLVTMGIGSAALACAKKPAQSPQTAPAAPNQPPAQARTPPVPSPPAAAPAGPLEEKLDAPLLDLIQEKGISSAESLRKWSAKHSLSTPKGQIKVDIACRGDKGAAAVAAAVRKAGGRVTSQFQNTVFASLPVAAIKTVAARDEVWTMAVSRALARPRK